MAGPVFKGIKTGHHVRSHQLVDLGVAMTFLGLALGGGLERRLASSRLRGGRTFLSAMIMAGHLLLAVVRNSCNRGNGAKLR